MAKRKETEPTKPTKSERSKILRTAIAMVGGLLAAHIFDSFTKAGELARAARKQRKKGADVNAPHGREMANACPPRVVLQ